MSTLDCIDIHIHTHWDVTYNVVILHYFTALKLYNTICICVYLHYIYKLIKESTQSANILCLILSY